MLLQMVIFFSYHKSGGIAAPLCDMASAISRHSDLLVVYDRRIEPDGRYLNRLQENSIEFVDVSELGKLIASRFETEPLLFHCHGFSHVGLAAKIARPTDRIMITMHSFRHGMWYSKWVALLTFCRFFKSIDMWQFSCDKSRDEYFWFRKVPSNTSVFPLGIEDSFMTKNEEPRAVKDLEGKEITDLANSINIVYIAHFHPCKRHYFLLRSLRSILNGNTYLFLLGEGRLLHKTIALSRKLGIRDNVIFTGKIDRKTVHYILCKANLSVTASASETFGWGIIESFCMNVPVVATNVGIASSVIHDFYNGFILNRKCTEEKFLEKTNLALEFLRETDNSQSKRLFSWETFAKASANCYKSLLGNGDQGQ